MAPLKKSYAEGPGCWEWMGYRDPLGYGRTNTNQSAHRTIYQELVGPIPDGFELDHLCRNRGCVNPDHLEPVTHLENMRRSAPAQKTHCVNGHLYEDANTYWRPSGQRDCRACIRDRVARYKQKKAA